MRKSHIFLDGTVWKSGKIPVLMVETGDDKDKYYRVTENGLYLLESYYE